MYHVHGNYWFACVPAICSRLFRQPLIIKYTRLGDDDARTIVQKRLGRFRLAAAYGWATRQATVVIALNSRLAQLHREHFPKVPVLELPNGVDIQRFSDGLRQRDYRRQALGIDPATRVLLFVGILSSRKGFDALLDAWRLFTDKTTEPTAVLLAVGPREGFYRELDLEKETRSTEPIESVIMLGPQPFHLMPELFAAADVFVLPTVSEGMPNSLLEAASSGLPAIASDVPGVREIAPEIADSLVLLDDVTPAALCSAISLILDTTASMHGAARTSVLPTRYSLSSLGETYSALYKQLMATPATGRRAAAVRFSSNNDFHWT